MKIWRKKFTKTFCIYLKRDRKLWASSFLVWLIVHETVSALSVCLPLSLIWLLPFHITVYKITIFAHKYSWRVFSKQQLEAFHFENTQTRKLQNAQNTIFSLGFKQCFNYDDHIFCWQVALSVEFIESEGWYSFIYLGLGQPLAGITTSEFVWFPLCRLPTWCCAGLLILNAAFLLPRFSAVLCGRKTSCSTSSTGKPEHD